ncbi:hypothetical protein WJX81_008493 [Elliptochloris bilobata]|uniref:Chaperone protein DnaJ n=1 Tax=Elliptochloris bilobata TaxID=381761 RepID=A0AAW1QVN5_9CHLO
MPICTYSSGFWLYISDSRAAAFPSEPDVLGSLASAVGLLLAGGLWFTLKEQETHDDRPECATCHGTGLEICACQRWSDGDVGCSTCHGTGKSVCRSCNGGGTAVPIAARAPKRNLNSYDMGSRQ